MSEAICNRCGLSCRLPDGHNREANHGLVDCHVDGSYDSTPDNGFGALDDCTRYTFSLCEFCLDWLFTTFRVPPTTRDITVDGIDLGAAPKWRPALIRVGSADKRVESCNPSR